MRLPILESLLDMILFEVQRVYASQSYLSILYKSLYCIGFHGLLRVGELTEGDHVIKARDVHLEKNKNKILIVLYSSKTHSKANLPQKVRITADQQYENKRHFCPFELIRKYLSVRGSYETDWEQFFIFRDKEPVKLEHARETLKKCIENLGLDSSLYNMHSLRIGKATQMLRNHFGLEEIKRAGRWRSNAVYKYLKM